MQVWREHWDNLVAYGITAAAAGVVLSPLLFFVGRRRFLPVQRQRQGRWSGVEVFFAIVLIETVPSVAIDLFDKVGFYQAMFVKPPSPMRMDIWAAPLSTLLYLAILFWVLFAGSKTRPANLGVTSVRWPQNALLGYAAFLILTPLVLGLYLVTSLFLREVFETAPQSHALTKLGREPLSLLEWGLLFFRATIPAALLEEVLFRGVFQGWLRRASKPGLTVVVALTLAQGLRPLLQHSVVQANDVSLVAATAAGLASSPAGLNPLLAAAVLNPEYVMLKGPNLGPLVFAALLAAVYGFTIYRYNKSHPIVIVFGSAMVFAAFHSNYWPTPIPLFALGIGLGYLAYRTQNLLAGFIVHSLFNTVACLALVLSRGT